MENMLSIPQTIEMTGVSTFNKRFKNNSRVNKKEVSNYMKKMKKENEEFRNDTLAEALAKLNLK